MRFTRSPWPAPDVDERTLALTRACGSPDAALARVASRLLSGGPADPDRAIALMRSEGQPHVRPRIVTASGMHAGGSDENLRAQLERVRTPASRCGLALGSNAEGEGRLVALFVEAEADLEELPMRARTGEWLTFSAHLHVPATGSRLVVLGPRGLPRTVPTSLDRSSGAVRARFPLDRPGAFTVQLVADVEGGPRPVLEARVFADVDPPANAEEDPVAPGERLCSDPCDPAKELAAMIADTRSAEQLSPVRRDARLDELARAHAESMMHARQVAHDLGDGDLTRRFDAAGLVAKSIGENVARATSPALAHRALYASPSHRMNLLGNYTHFGVGVVKDETGAAWVCEVFASGLR